MDRRNLILAPLAFFSALACKTRRIEVKRDPFAPDLGDRKIIHKDPDEDDGSDNPCAPVSFFDLASLDQAPEAYQCTRMIYGTPNKAMIAIKINGTYKAELVNIFIVASDGFTLAQKNISANVDIRLGSILKPIVFSNIDLSKKQDFCVVWQTSNSQGILFRLARFSEPLAFATDFMGTPVDAMSSTVLPSGFLTNTMLPYSYFGFKTLDGITLNPDADFSPMAAAKYCPNPNLKGFYVCDIMGEVLNRYGEQFATPMDYEFLVLYILARNSRYLRYILHLV